jgi:ABC-type antimicrobial peptide transport system permease subunit
MRDSIKAPIIGGILGAAVSLLLFNVADEFFPVSVIWDAPLHFGIVVLLVAIVSSAALAPARRATRVEPTKVLREN